MKPTYAYQIRHIQLAEPVSLPTVTGSHSGWYLVFWWKQIPVGQLFIEPSETLTQTQLWQKMYSVVQITCQAYQKDQPITDFSRHTVRPIDQQPVLAEQLGEVLGDREVSLLPVEVPISVVICTRNRSTQLQVALQSLQALSCKPQEIIVVDNAPTDDSTEQVVRQFANVVYCREPKVGLDVARNAGIRTAHMPVVAYIDDDVQVHAHWAYHIWQTFEQPEVGAMTGLVIAAELQTQAQLIFEKHWSFNRGYVDKYYDTAYFNKTLANGPPVWEIGAGANMAFRRDLFDTIGDFDERLDVGAAGCNGDSEMWFRLLAHGYTIHYNPRAVTFHEHRQELAGLRRQLFNYMRGHTAAALIQQQQYQQAGYYRHVFRNLPGYYFSLVRSGFPSFSFRHQTIDVEMKGVLSGLLFYFRNRKRSRQPLIR